MKEKKKRKPRKLKPWTDKWMKRAGEEALCFVTGLHPCADCHGPVISGYICGRCGSNYPGRDGYDDWTSP